ncbi:MAG: NnrS family protein [Vibrio sp.]
MQITDKKIEDKIPPLLRLGFRPFFLLGSVYALCIVPLWVWMFQTGQSLSLQVPPLWWHAHEMLFGFGMAIVAGFTLTAVQTWTGIAGTKSKRLGVLVGIWIVVRLMFWLPVPLWLTSSVEALFLLLLAYEMGFRVIKAKGYKNLFFIPLILLAIGVNFASYATIKGMPPFTSSAIWQAMLWWFMLLISIMGARVIPFFTARRFEFTKAQPKLWLDFAANLPLLLLMVLSFFPLQTELTRYVLIIGGGFGLLRMLRWRGWVSIREPLVWSLHLAFACLPLAMLWKGLSGNALVVHHLTHLLAIGALTGVILAMISRVTMGHTGRQIYQGPKMGLAYTLLFLAALIRGVLVGYFPAQMMLWINLAAMCWVISFGFYLKYFAPMLCRPRPDGHPG